MKRLMALAAGTEVVTGLALIIDPSVVTRLLFAGGLTAPGQALGRLAGFGLLSLALACWPFYDAAGFVPSPIRAMLLFGLLAACYLVYWGLRDGAAGPLLWPAAAFHAILALLLARVWLRFGSGPRPRVA